ncbi:MAG: FAD-dependent thymidylate synthase [bacterium]|nr:FAD-dependent thymidylate synthase [bacterium]
MNSFKINVEKLTNINLMRRACEMTMHKGQSKISLDKIYMCEHSPVRTQLFWVEMIGILTFVSVHFVRHKIGVEHFVTSNREDRGGTTNENRYTPVNHGMLLNAQALINMSRKRLCNKTHEETRKVMLALKDKVRTVDPDLSKYMVQECVYRGKCNEVQPCMKEVFTC